MIWPKCKFLNLWHLYLSYTGDSLSRAYEGHRSTRLRSRSPPAHSGGYGSSRHRSRSPEPRQASIDRPGGNGSLSRAYDEHRHRQVYNFWCFLPLHRGAFCQVHFLLIYYYHSSKSIKKETAQRTSVHCGSFLALFKTFCLFFRVNHLGGHMKIMIQGILQQFPHQGNLLRGIDNHLSHSAARSVGKVSYSSVNSEYKCNTIIYCWNIFSTYTWFSLNKSKRMAPQKTQIDLMNFKVSRSFSNNLSSPQLKNARKRGLWKQ